jgi:hypothetical protein
MLDATIPGEPLIFPPIPVPPAPDVPNTPGTDTPVEEPDDPLRDPPIAPDIKDPPLTPADRPYQL